MRGQKFILKDNKIIKTEDTDLKSQATTWKDNEKEGYINWTKFSRMKG